MKFMEFLEMIIAVCRASSKMIALQIFSKVLFMFFPIHNTNSPYLNYDIFLDFHQYNTIYPKINFVIIQEIQQL